MKKKIILLLSIFIVLSLFSCSSPSKEQLIGKYVFPATDSVPPPFQNLSFELKIQEDELGMAIWDFKFEPLLEENGRFKIDLMATNHLFVEKKLSGGKLQCFFLTDSGDKSPVLIKLEKK